jgi:hypothetical protein
MLRVWKDAFGLVLYRPLQCKVELDGMLKEREEK